jgi:predicted secreted protein
MRGKRIAFFCILILLAAALHAGDTAVFVDQGFSTDGRTDKFGQYGVRSPALTPWAELGIVDVAANDYVSGGRISYTHETPVTAGQDGAGTLYRLVSRNAALAERHGVGFLAQGRPLYAALDDRNGSAGETIEFRDFDGKVSYHARLNSQVEGSGKSAASSFYIRLERQDADGGMKTYIVGNSRIRRSGVSGYRIRNVITAPRDGYLIFVIEMRQPGASGGVDLRYMVEALKL